MEPVLATTETVSPEIIKSLVLDGDISKMNGHQKVEYFNRFCQSLGLNPLTQPFQIIKFQGKEKLYATKDCTEQLRKIHGVSIIELTSQEIKGVFVVTAKAQDKTGKTDAATGAVSIGTQSGEALANLLMKAETKAKRRVTLSICGLGMLDESELDTMPVHTVEPVQTKTNEISPEPVQKDKPKSEPKTEKKLLLKWVDGTKSETTKEWKHTIEALMRSNKPVTMDTVLSVYVMSDDLKNELEQIANSQKQKS